jgi:hypothetical protein
MREREFRPEEQREPKTFVRSGSPLPAEAPPACSLVLGEKHKPAERASGAELHQPFVRRIGLLEDQDIPDEASVTEPGA